MKRIGTISFLMVALLLSCVTTGSVLEDYFFLHGAALEDGPLGFTMTGSNENSMALRNIDTHGEEIIYEFSLQAAGDTEYKNGFLVLSDQDSGFTIVAGVYIGAREFAIFGSDVAEPQNVQAELDWDQVFNVSILANFENSIIEMKINDRQISTTLVPEMKQANLVGYHASATKTHFSEVTIIEKR